MNLSKGISDEVKELVFAYFRTPFKERETQKQFIKRNKIFRPYFYRIKTLYAIEEAEEVKRRLGALAETNERIASVKKAQQGISDLMEFNEDDPTDWWRRRTIEMNQAILASAKRGNAQSQKLAKQLAGELLEKHEVKVGLTADELTKRALEAQRQLREEGY